VSQELEIVKGFKSKFLDFVPPEKKERIEKEFGKVVAGIPPTELEKISKYILLYKNRVTDSEQIYFSKKSADLLKPFFL